MREKKNRLPNRMRERKNRLPKRMRERKNRLPVREKGRRVKGEREKDSYSGGVDPSPRVEEESEVGGAH